MPRKGAGETTDRQRLGGFKRRSQKTFNREHAQVREYGEEGEYLVLGNQFDEDEAKSLFREALMGDYGFGDAEADDLVAATYGENMSAAMWDGDPSYRIGSDDEHEALWSAWVVSTY